MKFFLSKRDGTIFAVIAILALVTPSIAFADHTYESVTVSPTDYAVLTHFFFQESGTTTDSQSQCAIFPPLSPCFTVQLNTDDSSFGLSNFYQSILYADPSELFWGDAIGCSSTSCTFLKTSLSLSPMITFSNSWLNDSNKVFVLVVNAGSSSETWGITSCNYSFTTPAYSFDHLVLDVSTCTASDRWTDTPPSGDFTGSAFTYMQVTPVGFGNASKATFHHTQKRGELFNHGLGTYTGSSYTLTGETSNIVLNDGTLGTVVPLCYYSPDVSAPC